MKGLHEPRRRFAAIFAATAMAGVAAAASINWLMDPYGIFGSATLPGLNALKPRPDVMVAEIKYILGKRTRPTALIVGDSRAEIGFDPENEVFQGRGLRAFNAAVPGAPIEYAATTVARFLTFGDIRVVVVGLEFLDFLRQPSQESVDHSLSEAHARLLGLFSSTALLDSARTLLIQRQRNPATLSADGFNPMLDYRDIAATEGYSVLFRQRAQESARTLAREPHSLYVGAARASPAYAALSSILQTAGQKHIDLRLVIYPYHVVLMSQLKEAGLWDLFEQWKADVAILAAEARKSGTQVSVWDFGCPDRYTAERVPADDDRSTTMRWYWEAGHFKKELGDVVLQTVFGSVQANRTDGFGLELTPANVADRNQVCSAALVRDAALPTQTQSRHSTAANRRRQAAGS